MLELYSSCVVVLDRGLPVNIYNDYALLRSCTDLLRRRRAVQSNTERLGPTQTDVADPATVGSC